MTPLAKAWIASIRNAKALSEGCLQDHEGRYCGIGHLALVLVQQGKAEADLFNNEPNLYRTRLQRRDCVETLSGYELAQLHSKDLGLTPDSYETLRKHVVQAVDHNNATPQELAHLIEEYLK